MIQADRLTKRYSPGAAPAVDDVSFEIAAGSVVGFLGPNGAGKSTTIRMLTGALPPTSGTARIAGFDALTQPGEVRRRLGYLPESNPLYPEMRSAEFLHFVGRLHGMSRHERKRRIGELTESCGLQIILRKTIGRLSKGNRQRVGIASVLMHDPEVVILDEPTSGLDPRQMSQVRDLILDLGTGSTSGTTKRAVLLSSHLLPEVQRCCDRAIIVAGGKVVADGTLDALRAEAMRTGRAGPVLIEARGTCEQVRGLLSGLPGVVSLEVAAAAEAGWVDAWLVAEATSPEATGADVREAAAEALSGAGVLVREIRRELPTLEEFFFRVTDVGYEPAGRLGDDTHAGQGVAR